MGKIEGSLGRGAATASFTYDFSVHGGAVGAVTLTADSGVLPDNALIIGTHVEALTTLTSGGAATVKLGYTGNDDGFKAATAYNNAMFVAEAVTAGTAETPIKVNAANGVNVLATIATAALTAGKFAVHVQYVQGS